MDYTLAQLRTELRNRLNDADSGNYTNAELLQCLNTAIADTELVTKCHIETMAVTNSGVIQSIDDTPAVAGTGYSVGDILTLGTGAGGTVEVIQVTAGIVIRVKLLTRGTGYAAATAYATTAAPSAGRSGCTVRVAAIRAALVSGTYTYDHEPIFDLIEASLHWTEGVVTTDAPLDIVAMKAIQSTADWNITAAGKPTKVMRLSGSQVRIHPTPNQTAASGYFLRFHGYAVSGGLVSDYDRPTSIPIGYRGPCLLDRAEAEARKMRLTTIPNVALYESLMRKWDGWCAKIIESLKGTGR